MLTAGCHQTSTSEKHTVRTNTVTGKSDRLVNGQWQPIPEARPRPNEPMVVDCATTTISPETRQKLGILCR